MTCSEFWEGMPELDETGILSEHARQCSSCAALLLEQHTLAAGLRRLAAETLLCQAPPRVESNLVEAFRRQGGLDPRAASHRQLVVWLTWASAAAVVLAAALYLILGRPPVRPGAQPHIQMAMQQATGDPAALDVEFIPTPYADDATVPDDADWIRVELPRSTLVDLGLQVPVADGPEKVQAAVALNADGVVQGVRLLQ
jgi:hypothetical protein